jgi:hypothetical protein
MNFHHIPQNVTFHQCLECCYRKCCWWKQQPVNQKLYSVFASRRITLEENSQRKNTSNAELERQITRQPAKHTGKRNSCNLSIEVHVFGRKLKMGFPPPFYTLHRHENQTKASSPQPVKNII